MQSFYGRRLAHGACLGVKNIGKPDAGKSHVRFDEGRLMNDKNGRHVVVACDEASIKVPVGNR
jgi:hypothetical protein